MTALLACGVISPVLFIAIWFGEGLTRPHYNAWTVAVSSLSLGVQGWINQVDLVLSGALACAFAAGVYRVLARRGSAVVGSGLLAVFGLGLIAAGVFVTDPTVDYNPAGVGLGQTLHGQLHFILGAGGVFFGLPAAYIALGLRLGRDPAWSGWRLYSVISGFGMFALFLGFPLTYFHHGPAGLFERLSFVCGCQWMAMLAIHMLRSASSLSAGFAAPR